ncbi:guanylate cyclase soluble subunit alpha-2-like isoform X2 [Dreissena polymorpha]|uniref:guanylate cyclase soluble subunit alpha-2-like isoform X2 n=1 Tax=Dreissena polymorpha TaxID=45954 RepID=UPI002264B057|nr:guanylate cyclase soluble subunit alpha-2-like isoform X2 [Dreissena polymorpha]
MYSRFVKEHQQQQDRTHGETNSGTSGTCHGKSSPFSGVTCQEVVNCPIMSKIITTVGGKDSNKTFTDEDDNKLTCTYSQNNTDVRKLMCQKPIERNESIETQESCNKCPQVPMSEVTSSSLSRDSGIKNVPPRKSSDISDVSISGVSEENEPEKKLDLRGLIESIGTLLIPVTRLVYKAVHNLLVTRYSGSDGKLFGFPKASESFDTSQEPIDDIDMAHVIKQAAKLSDETDTEFQRRLGDEYFRLCLEEYGDSIKMMGSNMTEFISNLDGLQSYISASDTFKTHTPPSARCETQKNKLIIHFYSPRSNIIEFYAGVMHGISRYLFNKETTVEVSYSKTTGSLHHTIAINAKEDDCSSQKCKVCSPEIQIGTDPNESKIGTLTFCKTFPFHFVIDKNLDIIQLGGALARHVVVTSDSQTRSLTLHFDIVKPKIEPLTYSALLSHVNFMFNLRTKHCDRSDNSQAMNLKGQMIHLPEVDGVLFLGTPSVEKLEELIEKGLYISDLPIHDATRDVILVGEQTKAQDGLRRRMEDLKKNIMEASAAVEEEKRKNVELLSMIFPSMIAQKLWRKETIEPQCIDNVTMLFSDIVGFTAICSSCSPMDVINMLNSLYTFFDNCCGFLDVYKETPTVLREGCTVPPNTTPPRLHGWPSK